MSKPFCARLVANFVISARQRLPQLALTVIILLATPPTFATLTTSPTAKLDLQRLAADPAVVADQVFDHVWNIQARPGATFIQLPLILTPASKPQTLARSPIILRGARFVCFRIQPTQSQKGQNHYRNHRFRNRRRNLQPQEHRVRHQHYDPLHGEDQNANFQSKLPTGAPRVARRITLHPDGSVTWKLEIAIPGENVAPGYSDYMLRLRGWRLQNLIPQHTPPKPRPQNESFREYHRKLAEAESKFRTQMQQFVARRKRVQHLPTHFQVDHPAVIWAVYEIASATHTIDLIGPAPLPWRITFTRFNQIRAFATTNHQQQHHHLQVRQLIDLARHGKPTTQWFIAEALAAHQKRHPLKPAGPIYQLTSILLKSPSVRARRVVARGLADQQHGQYHAATRLLRKALHDKDATVKFDALQGLFSQSSSSRHRPNLASLITTANVVLQAPDGPPPTSVLNAVLNVVHRNQDAATGLRKAIDFAKIPPQRRLAAIKATIREAPVHSLAAAWLDRQLLGSKDPRLVNQTLLALSQMKLTHATGNQSPNRFAHQRKSHENQVPDDPNALDQRITIASGNNHLLALLASPHRQQRTLAWKDLSLFVIKLDAADRYDQRPTGGNKRGSNHNKAKPQNPFQIIVSHGLAQQPVPTQLVPFLERQPNARQTTSALIHIIIHAHAALARQAANAILNSGNANHQNNSQLGSTLQTLSASDRVRFANKLYTLLQNQSTPVVGLLAAQHDSQIESWFADQLQTGILPKPSDWASAFQNDQQLLRLAASSNPNVSHAAATVLVLAAGGTAQTAKHLSQRLDQIPNKTESAVEKQWKRTRANLYLKSLKNAGGQYQLSLTIQSPGDIYPPTPIVLGSVKLIVNAAGVTLANQTIDLSVGNQPGTIAVTNLTDLKNFDNPKLKNLSLNKTAKPLQLRRQSSGKFQGHVQLHNGKTLTLTFTPTNTQ